jgi:translation initiation factor 1 (eIF-1/SUI1)
VFVKKLEKKATYSCTFRDQKMGKAVTIVDGISDKEANLSRLAQKLKSSAPAAEKQKTMK